MQLRNADAETFNTAVTLTSISSFGVPTCAPATESNTSAGETDFLALLATTHFCWVPGCCFHPCSVHKKNKKTKQKKTLICFWLSHCYISPLPPLLHPANHFPPPVSHMLTSSHFSADAWGSKIRLQLWLMCAYTTWPTRIIESCTLLHPKSECVFACVCHIRSKFELCLEEQTPSYCSLHITTELPTQREVFLIPSQLIPICIRPVCPPPGCRPNTRGSFLSAGKPEGGDRDWLWEIQREGGGRRLVFCCSLNEEREDVTRKKEKKKKKKKKKRRHFLTWTWRLKSPLRPVVGRK